MKKIKILFVTHHWKNNSHHSLFGGYQRLVEFMPSNKIESTILTWGEKDNEYYDGKIKVIIKRIPRLMRFFFKRKILSDYASKFSKDYDIVHALYDDVAPTNSKKPLITTIHTIKDLDTDSLFLKYKFFKQKRILKKSDKIIVLSDNMKELISNYISSKKIVFIPHGIDTNHFIKKNKISKDLLRLKDKFEQIILCVGNYGTDKKDLIQIGNKYKDILFIILNRNWNLKNKKNIIFLKEVSEERLLELYSISSYLYRPLKFSSANNSILEAISIGIPVITTPTEGVKDYINKDNSFVINNKRELEEILDKKSSFNNINANRFDWKNINKRIFKEYISVLK